MASLSKSIGSGTIFFVIIAPLILLCFCLWMLFRQIPHSLFQILWQCANSFLQQQTNHLHTLSQAISHHSSPTTDAENSIPLTDILSITHPSSVVTHRECFIIPPMLTIIPPTPPNISPRSSESFKCFDNIWTGPIPSPTAPFILHADKINTKLFPLQLAVVKFWSNKQSQTTCLANSQLMTEGSHHSSEEER